MKKEKKSLNDHFIVHQKLLVAGFFIMLSAIFFQNAAFYWFPLVLGTLVMISGVMYAARYFKCPHCGTRLDARMKAPNYCPECGKKLQ